MSVTAPGRPVPPPPPGRPDQAVEPGAAPRSGRSTPWRMRALAYLLVVVGLAVVAVSVQTFVGANQALSRADANVAQLVRLQDVQTSLVQADADVTNSFLVGGLEPADQRADYTAAVSGAVQQIAYAARAQPADGTALAALATEVQDYTSTIELARANNRQALPVGAQYLKNASAGLRADALPTLAALIEANEQRVDVELGNARTSALLVGGGLLGLAVLLVAMVWLARRTHRYLNLPMAGATVLLAVYLVVAATAMAGVSSAVTSTERGPYAAARALSEARIAAFDAKSNESLTLVARGSGAAFEEAWQTAAGTVVTRLDDAAASTWAYPGEDPTGDWESYAALHADIRAADDGGDWDAAVALATSRDEGSANAAFSAFDAGSAAALEQAGTDVSDALAGPRGSTVPLAVVGALVGLAVAALSWRGIGRRIEEYR